MQVYDIALKPGESRQIHVQADYIYFLNGSAAGADTTIEFRPNSGGETVYLKPGQAFKLPASQRGMGITWVMKNLKGEATIIGQVLMGEGEFQDNRISGSVEVIDGAKARTLAAVAFSGAFGTGAAQGCYSRISLWNPENSGKNVILETIALSSNLALPVNLFKANEPATGVQARGQGKLLNASNLQSAALGVQDANQTGTGPGVALYQLSVIQNGKDVWAPKEPIVIAPGRALMAWANVPNVGFALSMEWFEESV